MSNRRGDTGVLYRRGKVLLPKCQLCRRAGVGWLENILSTVTIIIVECYMFDCICVTHI